MWFRPTNSFRCSPGVNCPFKRAVVDTWMTSMELSNHPHSWHSLATPPFEEDKWTDWTRWDVLLLPLLQDEPLVQQQKGFHLFGLPRHGSAPAGRSGSPRLSGSGSVLQRPQHVLRQHRMEARPLIWHLLLRPGLRVHAGLLPRLRHCLSRWVCVCFKVYFVKSNDFLQL